MAPMHDDVCQRYDTTPDKYLVDGGFHTKDDISTREHRGTQVFAPIHGEAQMIEHGTDPHARQKTDTDERAAFRQRMATDDAKQLSALRQLCWRPTVSGRALAAGLGETNRRLAPNGTDFRFVSGKALAAGGGFAGLFLAHRPLARCRSCKVSAIAG